MNHFLKLGMFLPLALAPMACSDAEESTEGATNSALESYTFDGANDGVRTSCTVGTLCTATYARSLVEHIIDKDNGYAIKLGAGLLGSCFGNWGNPRNISELLTIAGIFALPKVTTALCIASAGFAGAGFINSLRQAAQGGKCLAIDFTSGPAAAAIGLSQSRIVATGAACDDAEREWQAAHAPPQTAIEDLGHRVLYNPIAPARLLDTRATGAKVSAISEVEFLARNIAGIPFSAAAVQLNVTVTQPNTDGFVTLWQSDRARPALTSNVNFRAGQTIANAVTVAVGSNNKVKFFSNTGTHLIVDVVGYYDTSGSWYEPKGPFRAYDSRWNDGPVWFKNVVVTSDPGVTAAALNVTAVSPPAYGYLTVFPYGSAMPPTSNLNYEPGQFIASHVTSGIGGSGGGWVSLYSPHPTNLLVDVMGQYKAGGNRAIGFAPVTPFRVHDTRSPNIRSIRAGTRHRSVNTVYSGAPTTRPRAVVANFAVTNTRGPGYVTAYACDKPMPTASILNYSGTEGSVANQAIVPVDPDNGTFCYYASADTDVIIDIQGYHL